MTYENPPRPDNNNENFEDVNNEQIEALNENTVVVDPKEMEKLEDLEAEVKFRTSDTAEKIREAQAKKSNVDMDWDNKTQYRIPPTNQRGSGLKKMMLGTAFTLSSLFGFANKGKNVENAGDSTIKNNKIENFADSTEKSKEVDFKKYEQFGISHIEKLESNDKENDIFLVSVPEYKSYGDVFNVLNKAGLTPVSTEKMDEAVSMNQDLFKKAGSIISLNEVVNKLGNPSYSTVTWDKKANTFHGESREIQVMKAKKGEQFSNFDSDYDRYNFIVKAPKEKTADYESGLAKK
ncbi:MAG: hypothetical protein KBC11_02020 [Candidatus Pacebacteria bacterium]|nr:hypothetical protein [Candidatus Paceibacterota bacterium]